MEIQFTPSFAKAKNAHEHSLEIANREDCREAVQQERDRAERELLFRLLTRRAETAAELRFKFDTILERELYEAKADFWAMVRGAFESDIDRIQRPEPSHSMRSSFQLWRNTHHAMDDSIDNEDMECRLDARTSAFRNILASPCVTAGDFMVKAYMELLEGSGPEVGENEFDPNTDEFADERDNGDAYKRSLYADLDACDLGACLLSFGRTHFNPRNWLERAQAVELPFEIEEQQIRIRPSESADPKQAREQARLVRILQFDPRRVNQLAELIEARTAANGATALSIQAKAA